MTSFSCFEFSLGTCRTHLLQYSSDDDVINVTNRVGASSTSESAEECVTSRLSDSVFVETECKAGTPDAVARSGLVTDVHVRCFVCVTSVFTRYMTSLDSIHDQPKLHASLFVIDLNP